MMGPGPLPGETEAAPRDSSREHSMPRILVSLLRQLFLECSWAWWVENH